MHDSWEAVAVFCKYNSGFIETASVTDWSSALAGFLVSILFGVSLNWPESYTHCILSGSN